MQVAVDFGLVVLTWMVQLIIYPSFLYYREQDLAIWHKIYTKTITIIVLPLMVGQVFFHGLSIIEDFNVLRLILVAMILTVWLITFLVAVPLHGRIGNDQNTTASINSLIHVNWYRTVLWSLIFLFQFLNIEEKLTNIF